MSLRKLEVCSLQPAALQLKSYARTTRFQHRIFQSPTIFLELNDYKVPKISGRSECVNCSKMLSRSQHTAADVLFMASQNESQISPQKTWTAWTVFFPFHVWRHDSRLQGKNWYSVCVTKVSQLTVAAPPRSSCSRIFD